MPKSPAGAQLSWLLGLTALPLSAREISKHFDATFSTQVSPAKLNSVFTSLTASGRPTLFSLSTVTPRSINAIVDFGAVPYAMSLSVNGRGLIDGLVFSPDEALPTSWAQIDGQLSAIAPDVSFLAATVNADGSCTAVHEVNETTARPLASMFKLFVLGALANAVREHKIRWTQKVTLTAAIKTASSEDLGSLPNGTKLTVQQVATDMISVSDNTAADLLLKLVGRSAVEAQARRWVTDSLLDVPFLTVSELFALKDDEYPTLANQYLSLGSAGRSRLLSSKVDHVKASQEEPSLLPHDIDSLEWFAAPDDLCRAFTGLDQLATRPGLSQINSVLSTNNGGIELNPTIWPHIWFKGGSEARILPRLPGPGRRGADRRRDRAGLEPRCRTRPVVDGATPGRGGGRLRALALTVRGTWRQRHAQVSCS